MMLLLIGSIVVLVGVYMLLVETIFKSSECKSSSDMVGKTVIITGGNTGIGKATACELARRGARVILSCRNKQKAEEAIKDIELETGSTDVVYMQLDLANLKAVRTFAETFLKTESRLDLLINNAGLVGDGRTEDGFGIQFGVNHLGHFLLTCLLLDCLKEAPSSRVITLSSMAHRWGVVKTELSRHVSLWQMVFVDPISRLFFLDPKAGAQTTLHCALQEGIEPLSGRYFACCTVQEPCSNATDDAVAKKLWDVSERLCGLSDTS
ncbi:dehydrogenase/reductase SDR family member 13a.2 isoform X2 [Alosa alosa]|uniref:dehydrogenase/reductase SDR family member 13a.2 isoform X2 n=1 Tax=Alosa alosa TaxID=278164 RepID=UPI0020152855|nr:dehydrogenase/reductase SDR family member 13a.2 isoform X2 [Alosa alosa]